VADCAAVGASFHLATLTDTAELNAVGALVSDNQYWIGGNDMAVEGIFVWITNESWSWLPAIYPPWGGSNPSNSGGNEHCVELHGGNNDNFNDDTCSKSNRRICEYTPPG